MKAKLNSKQQDLHEAEVPKAKTLQERLHELSKISTDEISVDEIIARQKIANQVGWKCKAQKGRHTNVGSFDHVVANGTWLP